MNWNETKYYWEDKPFDPRWDQQTACRWRIDQDIKMRYDLRPYQLQAKWRGMNQEGVTTFPVGEPFPWEELEYALLDAFVSEGQTVWRGDGSSCAVQIVENIWRLAQEAIKERDLKIAQLKDLL